MLVFWSLFSLVRNSVVLAVYLLFSVACFFTVHEHCSPARNASVNWKNPSAMFLKRFWPPSCGRWRAAAFLPEPSMRRFLPGWNIRWRIWGTVWSQSWTPCGIGARTTRRKTVHKRVPQTISDEWSCGTLSINIPALCAFLVRDFLSALLHHPSHSLPCYHHVRQITVPLLKLDSFLCEFQLAWKLACELILSTQSW